MKVRVSAFVVMIVWLTGCQSVNVPQRESHTAQPSFMETWRIYTHCASTEGLEPLMVDTLLLKRATNRMQQDEVLGLFSPLQAFISPSPVRLAADTRAMTASFTLIT